MIEASDGKHVWAERFDKSGADPLAVQDEVTAKIVATLTGECGQIRRADYQRAWGKDTANLKNTTTICAATAMLVRDTREDYQRAAAIYREGSPGSPIPACSKSSSAPTISITPSISGATIWQPTIGRVGNWYVRCLPHNR